MTGHSWVAPGRNKLLEIAGAAGYTGHRQRVHGGGGSTGAANAIWLKEFGKWNEDTPPGAYLAARDCDWRMGRHDLGLLLR